MVSTAILSPFYKQNHIKIYTKCFLCSFQLSQLHMGIKVCGVRSDVSAPVYSQHIMASPSCWIALLLSTANTVHLNLFWEGSNSTALKILPSSKQGTHIGGTMGNIELL